LAFDIHLDPGGVGGRKMQVPPQEKAQKAARAQQAYVEWDKTYAYFQMGFTPRLI